MTTALILIFVLVAAAFVARAVYRRVVHYFDTIYHYGLGG